MVLAHGEISACFDWDSNWLGSIVMHLVKDRDCQTGEIESFDIDHSVGHLAGIGWGVGSLVDMVVVIGGCLKIGQVES